LPWHVQVANLGDNLVEFDPAGLRHAQAMPKHEKQQVTVADLGSKPTIKQKLAAIRMLYDFLVIRQLVPVNPTGSVRSYCT
jgi:hypothetical protein